MFNVLIFDRKIEDIEFLKKFLNTALFKEVEYTIYAFDNEDALIDFVENSKVFLDLIFLDSDSETNLGFFAADNIRKINVKSNIVFISDDKDGLELGYKYNAFDYILKPISEYKINEMIKRLFFYIDNSNSYFYVKIGGTIERIRENSILYFVSSGRKVSLYSNDNVIDFYAKMDEVYDQLNKDAFCRIHQSYIVNMNHIVKSSKNQVLIDNNEIIPISKKYFDDFKSAFKSI